MWVWVVLMFYCLLWVRNMNKESIGGTSTMKFEISHGFFPNPHLSPSVDKLNLANSAGSHERVMARRKALYCRFLSS